MTNLPILNSTSFGSTFSKFGRIQGRLAWPLYKADMQILEVSLMVPEAEASCAAYRVFIGYV